MARSISYFDKYPDEIIGQYVDFTDAVNPGKIVVSGTVVVEPGGDLIVSGPVIDHPRVNYSLVLGTSGNQYTVIVQATISDGELLEHRVIVNVL